MTYTLPNDSCGDFTNKACAGGHARLPDGTYLDDVEVCSSWTVKVPCEFRTQTQGGWGTEAHGNNPGAYRDAKFAECFPEGLVVGCIGAVTLTTSTAVQAFLPQGGKPMSLDMNYIDPVENINVLAGQVTALTLNVGFDICDEDFSENGDANLNDLVVVDEDSLCFGMTVEEVLTKANEILGNCGNAITASEINECVSAINENFVDGEEDNGYLGVAE
jgi:hypothetical protein